MAFTPFTPDEHPSMANFNAKFQGLSDDTMELVKSVATPYSNTTAYSVGDYCSVDTEIYRCITAIPEGGEAWDPTHWAKTTIAGELRAIASSGGGGSASNENLLDNWYFVDPINQRGQTKYTGSGYTIDRWYSHGVSVTVSDGCLTITTGGNNAFAEILEENLFDRELTFSILTADGSLYTGTGSLSSTSENYHQERLFIEQEGAFNLFLQMYNGYLSASVGLGSATALSIRAAKLELGPIQTLAHQDTDGTWVLNDPSPDFTLELLKCQRYFQLFASSNLRPSNGLDFRPVMRTAKPTLGTININGTTYYTASSEL